MLFMKTSRLKILVPTSTTEAEIDKTLESVNRFIDIERNPTPCIPVELLTPIEGITPEIIGRDLKIFNAFSS